MKFSIVKFSRFALILLIIIVLMPQMISLAQQDRGLKVTGQAAPSEQRVALIIGNGAYSQGSLTNSVNDAQDMATTLRTAEFEVLYGENQNRRQMRELIRQFGEKIRNGGVGLFYYAGHGVQVKNTNYIIPVGAEITKETEVEDEAISVDFVLAQMEDARNKLNIVILDACRNNPFARSFRSGSRGLAVTRSAPTGTLVAYATAADSVASDGSGRNGLFTQELLTNLKTPGLTLESIFRRTRTSVRSKSSGQQVPYEYTSVEGEDFYFLAPGIATPTVATPVVTTPTVTTPAITLPAVTSPAVTTLAIATPTVMTPPVATPTVTTPAITTPAVTTPPVASPAVASPTLTTPTVTRPPVATPTIVTPEPVIATTPPVTKPLVRMSVVGVPLAAMSFTTASVEANGSVTNQRQEQTFSFIEDFGNGIKLSLVEIPGGTFQMGSTSSAAQEALEDAKRYSKNAKSDWFAWEQPQHQVSVGAFAMGKYEVTQAQWQAIMGSNPSNFKGAELPVEQVSWEDAQEFCRKLSAKTGRKYRLPTEAEWEYAARAGTTTAFAFGETISPQLVNYDGNYPYKQAAKGSFQDKTVAVGSLGIANGFGLYDMHGNVWEWCEDVWHESYKSAPSDGSAWLSDGDASYRVIRGGSWVDSGWYCHIANRGRHASSVRHGNGGFRVVVSAKAQ